MIYLQSFVKVCVSSRCYLFLFVMCQIYVSKTQNIKSYSKENKNNCSWYEAS